MTKTIPLTQGKVAIVDDDDFDRLAIYSWFAMACGRGEHFYAARHAPNKQPHYRMHREILGLPPGRVPEVDHVDGDGLNNTRRNLRRATVSQNQANRRLEPGNTSRFKGVNFHNGKWEVRLMVAGRRLWLGRFEEENAAARAYDEAAAQHFGEFALLNLAE